LTTYFILSDMRSRVSVAVAGLLAAAVVGTAAPAQAAPAYPRASGRCVDQTGVLGGELCEKITTILLREEKATSDEIAVAVVPTTGDESIKAWSTGLFNTWGIGKKERNNGVLLVVAVNDHKVRLATGRGAADRLTDDEARPIIDEVVTPAFADEDYPLGILSGLDEVRRTLGHRVPGDARLESLTPAAADPVTDGGSVSTEIHDDDADGHDLPVWVIVTGLFAVGLFAVFIYRVSKGGKPSGTPTRRRSSTTAQSAHHSAWMSSTSSSGSGSGFGGGSSDGSGASGSW
jgi:uncharacterized protein